MTVASKPGELSQPEFHVPVGGYGVHSQLEKSQECTFSMGHKSHGGMVQNIAKTSNGVLSQGWPAKYSMALCAVCVLSLLLIFCLVLSMFLHQNRVELEVRNLALKVSQLEEKLHKRHVEDMDNFRSSIRSELSESVKDIAKQYLNDEDGRGVTDILELFSQTVDLDDSEAISDEIVSSGSDNTKDTGGRKRRNAEKIEDTHSPSIEKGTPIRPRHIRHKRNRHCSRCLQPNAISIDHLQGNRSISSGTEDVYRNWKHTSWSTGESRFNRTSGALTIREGGIYFVYAQVMFINAFVGPNGFDVILTRSSPEGDPIHSRPILSCKHSVDYFNASRTENQNIKYKTCFTARPVPLSMNDTLVVKSKYAGRKVLFHQSTSFWGVVKLPFANGM